jgi:hypothetical protein
MATYVCGLNLDVSEYVPLVAKAIEKLVEQQKMKPK